MQRKFYDWLNEKKRLSEHERECLAQRDFSDAVVYWNNFSEQAKVEFDVQHDMGWRYWAKSAQTIAAAAGQFLKDFKPLVEFVSNANPFGGLAVGAISGLFAIAQSKRKTDDIVAIAIAGMMDRLPGYHMLQDVYKERNPHQSRLRKKILIAYGGVIELSIASAKYYLQPGVTRWWLATWNPEKFTLLADKVQGYAVAVVMQREELLTWAVNEIKKEGKKQTCKIDELKEHNNEQTHKIEELQEDSKKQTHKIEELQEHNNEQTHKIEELQEHNNEQTHKIEELQEDNNRTQQTRLEDLLGLSGWSSKEQQQRLSEYERTLNRAREDSRPYE